MCCCGPLPIAAGHHRAEPLRVFRFEETREAHRAMEANEANGKVLVAD
jgi:NADPH:quinone reductase